MGERWELGGGGSGNHMNLRRQQWMRADPPALCPHNEDNAKRFEQQRRPTQKRKRTQGSISFCLHQKVQSLQRRVGGLRCRGRQQALRNAG